MISTKYYDANFRCNLDHSLIDMINISNFECILLYSNENEIMIDDWILKSNGRFTSNTKFGQRRRHNHE